MKTRVITMAVIKYKDEYLIAKRASSKEFAPDKWEFISGFVDTNETSEEIILRELDEELKIIGTIKKSGNPYIINDEYGRWITIPFLIEANNSNFSINKKDHSEVKWVELKELEKYKDLKEDVKEMKRDKLF